MFIYILGYRGGRSGGRGGHDDYRDQGGYSDRPPRGGYRGGGGSYNDRSYRGDRRGGYGGDRDGRPRRNSGGQNYPELREASPGTNLLLRLLVLTKLVHLRYYAVVYAVK